MRALRLPAGPRLALALALLCVLAACGYSTRRLADLDGARSVAVSTFSNLGFRRDLELRLTQAVIAEVRARTTLAIDSPGRADLVLSGRMQADEDVVTLDADNNPVQKRLYGSLLVTVTDRRSGRVVRTFTATGQAEFAPGRDGESLEGSASDEWVRRVAIAVVQGLEGGF
ncbi:MAG: hypothetical protein ACKOSS_00400 [Planctomycetia bacterium]